MSSRSTLLILNLSFNQNFNYPNHNLVLCTFNSCRVSIRDLRIGNFRSNRISNRIRGYNLNSNRISNRIGG